MIPTILDTYYFHYGFAVIIPQNPKMSKNKSKNKEKLNTFVDEKSRKEGSQYTLLENWKAPDIFTSRNAIKIH